MCGIAGFASSQPNEFTEVNLVDLTYALVHRGPDNQGIYYQPTIGLGHRRLSIQDLSDLGNQPFYSSNERYVAVFNGEIYNFLELKKQIFIPLRSGSDTEVLVELFAKKGFAVLNELNGMFAFVIYDLQEQQLFIGRDHIGKKPLYYYHQDGKFVFASELKSFLHLPSVKKDLTISKEAIGYFLHVGYIPEPLSIYKEIKKFPSASFAVLDIATNQLQIQPFWKAEEQISKTVLKDEKSAKRNLSELLESSIKYRLIADVPTGSFLSGGIDSSIVTALASKVSNERLKTFSIGFKDWDKNEAVHAKKVAEYLQTDHHELYLTENEALDLFDALMDVYDEPFADASAIPTLLVSRFARETVKVALSGDGGDELFQGYGAYSWANRLSHPLIKIGKGALKFLLENSSADKHQRAANLFANSNPKNLYSHIFSQEQYYFSEWEIDQLLNGQTVDFELVNPQIKSNRKLLPREKQALTDLKTYLKDDLLVKVDRASMRYALEVRSPLLDYRIVEFSLNLDLSLKVKNGHTKYLLKQVLFDHVPPKYFDRPKWGFSIPLNKWLKNDLHYLIEKYISEERILEAGLVNPLVVRDLLLKWKSGKDYLYNRVWQLIILHRWYFNKGESFGH